AALGYGVLAGLAALYRRVRGFDGLGLGDAKLLGAAGAWVGPLGLPSVLVWASAAGLLAAGGLALAKRDVGWRTALPFGPALALGFWITWLHGPLLIG
ncbi:MAG: A24 family peptidase, partial [Caulobacterales bacterium]|nr:A24 family peptidase [Caulobacterales bacterium]